MTKGEEVYTKVEALIEGGKMTKAEAFKQLAEEYGQPVDSLRGSYYSFSGGKVGFGTGRKPRRRETRLEDAVADARSALETAIQAVDREVEAAAERAKEAKAEHDSLKASAEERKAAITEKLEALR